MCVGTLLSEAEETDEEISAFSVKGTSIAFKIAFNTLLKYNILIEEEEDE
jgi:hypothetical protein